MTAVTVRTNGQTLLVNASISYWTSAALALTASSSNDVESTTWTTITSDTTLYFANTATAATITVKQADGTTIGTYPLNVQLGVGPYTLDPVPDRYQSGADLSLPTAAFGKLVSGYYYITAGTATTTTASMGAADVMKAYPWVCPNSISLTKIGAEVTTIGEAGSKVRLGIYADDGTGRPGSLVVDAGQIAGDSATVQELTIDTTLSPGLYWMASAAQSCATTRPTVRTALYQTFPMNVLSRSTIPTANELWMGFGVGSVSGALPASFGTPILQTLTSICRIFIKT